MKIPGGALVNTYLLMIALRVWICEIAVSGFNYFVFMNDSRRREFSHRVQDENGGCRQNDHGDERDLSGAIAKAAHQVGDENPHQANWLKMSRSASITFFAMTASTRRQAAATSETVTRGSWIWRRHQ